MATRNRKKLVLALAVVAVAALALTATSTRAALVQTATNNNSKTAFDGNISGADLINVGSATLGSFNTSVTPSFGALGTHDGNAIHTSGLGYWGNSPSGVDLTYALTGSANGYDITSINTIYGWNDSRSRHSAQRYSVSVATVSNPTFSPLTTVLYDPFGDNAEGSSQVTLNDDTGMLATGVTAIRFHATTDNGREVGVIRELDVFGEATTASSSSRPVQILGVTATASSELTGTFNRVVGNIVDNFGLDTTIPDGNPGQAEGMWLNKGTFTTPNDLDPEVVFDLGSVEKIGDMRVYNYNEAAAGLFTRGVNELEILVSNDNFASDTRSLGLFNFDIGTGTSGLTGQLIDLGGVEAQFVKFDIISNHGGDNNFVGLNEVQFFAAAAVPEPSTFGLAALGLVSLGCVGWRRRRRA